MLLLSLRHSEAKERDKTMMVGMNEHDQWIQVLACTEEAIYFWVVLSIRTVVHHYMK